MGSCFERQINASLWLSLIAVTAFLLGRLAKVFSLWAKARRLPGPPCTSFYGHGRLFSTATLTDILYTCHKKYGEVVKVWLGPTQLMVSVADTDLIEEVLLKAADKLPLTGKAFRLAFGKSSLFISSFEKVEHQRKSLEMKLGGALLERACLIPSELLNSIIERSQLATTNSGVGCEIVSQHLAFSILGTTIFGDVFLAWPKATIYEELLMKIAKDACFWASCGIITPFWKHEFWKYKDSCTKLKCLTQELIKECRQTGKLEFFWDSGGHDTMGYEPCGEIISLMFHGSLTMAALIANILTRLMTHQHIQDKIHSELVNAKEAGKRVEQDDNLMPNLLATLYESVRLLPAGPLLQRCSLQHDLSLKNGMVIPAGSIIVVPVQLVQIDCLFWGKDAGKFNPCRFLSQSDGKVESLAVPNISKGFLPFGAGARVCIGQKLAVRAISTLFAALVENYEIRLAPESESNPKPVINNHVFQLLPSPKVVFIKRCS